MIRLLYFIPAWLAFLAIKIPTILLGVVVVPVMYAYRDMHYDILPKWMRPWANPEDWYGGPKGTRDSLPRWWIDRHEGEVGFLMWWHYHAIRNPANGLRSFEWLDLDIIPDLVRYKTPRYLRYYEPWYVRKMDILRPRTYWYLAWQGWQAGFKLVHHWNDERHLVIKLGWRVQPSDAEEAIDPDGIRVEDAGFATKFLPYRKG